MRNKSLHRLCTLLLALILVIMPVFGFAPAAHADGDPNLDPNLLMPWGARWDGLRLVRWETPIGASGSVSYKVTLVTADDANGSGAQRISFLPVTGNWYRFDQEYIQDRTKYYRAEVRALKPGDAQIYSFPAYTEYIYGKKLLGGYTPLHNDELSERMEFRVDQTISAENRKNLNIDRSQYVKEGELLPAYEQAELYGILPPGMDWGYGDAETPYLKGTPTKLGWWQVDVTVHLSNGQNIRDTVDIIVLPQSMEYTEKSIKYVQKGEAITPVKPVYTGTTAVNEVGIGGVSSGSLPPGLEIDFEKGVISGTPTQAGKYSAKIIGYDRFQYQYFYNITFMVIEQAGAYATEKDLELGKKYDFYLTPQINGHYETTMVVKGSLPPGMDWKESETKGVEIYGTPTQAGRNEILFKVINTMGQWSYETLYLNVLADVKALDLYEVNLTDGSLTMSKTEYQKVLKGTLEAAVKGQQIQCKEVTVKIGSTNVTGTYYDLNNDNKHDLLVMLLSGGYDISQVLGNYKYDDFFLDLNEASVYAAQHGTSDYAETVAFRVPGPKKNNPFYDIDPESYCYEPVLWAYNNDPQITKGLSDTQFGQGEKCTRAQIVTFLWRAAGSPEPSKKTTDFTDVDLGSWYGKAVLWAVEKGITSGVSSTSFAPNGDCTRAQVVTFLFRFGGRIVGDSAAVQFKDLDPSKYYADAVDWAVKYNITKGTSDNTFGPDKSCTRGQIVTFLYRLLYSFNNLKETDFFMHAENTGMNDSEQYYFGGTIISGSVRFGSRIRILSYNKDLNNSGFGHDAVVTRIQVRKGNRFVDVKEAAKDQYAVVYFEHLDFPMHVKEGDALVGYHSDINWVNTNVWATVTMESAADPNNELREGMKPMVYVYGDVTATVSEIYGGELKKGQTGENVLWIDFVHPVTFYVGQEVAIRKGGRTCGKMKITKIGP